MNLENEIEIYVRFSETDAAGHVNNASYFFYLEEARMKFFNKLGLGVATEDSAPLVNFILASTECNYIAQAYAGQILQVSTRVSHIGDKSFTVEHEVNVKDSGERIVEAKATMVSFNYKTQQTETIPGDIRFQLERHFVK